MISQNISTQRVRVAINSKHDTVIEVKLSDAKVVLNEIFNSEFCDSINDVLTTRDSINSNIVNAQKKEIFLLNEKVSNNEKIDSDYKREVYDKDKVITDLNSTIEQQKHEIFRQKLLKAVGFTLSAILPITVLLLVH